MSLCSRCVPAMTCVAVLALASSSVRAEDPQKLAEVTKEHLAAKVPNFFYFDYDSEPQPGKRLWLRIDNQHFVERYLNGLESKFKILGRTKVNGIQGTVLGKIAGDEKETGRENDGSFRVFIPDRGSEKPELQFWQGEQWNSLGEMKKVE